MMTDPNRKTNIPIKSIPGIVEWLLQNCSIEELEWMGELAGSRKQSGLLKAILLRLTDYNVYEVFYEKHIQSGTDLLVYRAAKRGEVAGLKAFEMACYAAKEELKKRRKGSKK